MRESQRDRELMCVGVRLGSRERENKVLSESEKYLFPFLLNSFNNSINGVAFVFFFFLHVRRINKEYLVLQDGRTGIILLDHETNTRIRQ